MFIQSRIARRYAKALYKESVHLSLIEEVKKEFKDFIFFLSSNSELKILFRQDFSIKLLKDIFKNFFSKEEFSELFIKFIFVLIEAKRFIILFQVYESFQEFIDKDDGTTFVMVDLAVNPTEKIKNKIIKELKAFFKLDLRVKFKIRPEIIGGMIIHYDDSMVDLSLKYNLQKIKNFVGV